MQMMNLPIAVKSLDPKIQLKKHSAIIHFKGSLSNVDHKTLNILYKCAFENDNFSSEQYQLKINDIITYLGWKNSKYDDILHTLRKLKEISIEWNIFEQDAKNKKEWKEISNTGFIAEFAISKYSDIVTFSIGPTLRKLLSKPNIYAYIDLSFQKKLKGRYDLILYEYFLEELYRNGQKDIITKWYSINDIRRMLNMTEGSYQEFKQFNRYCIKEPLKSINENTNILAEIADTERFQKRINAFKFKICFKTNAEVIQCTLDLDDTGETEVQNYDVLSELTLFFGDKAALTILEEAKEKYPNFYKELIIKNIEFSKKRASKGTVLSLQAFMRSAIVNDYAKYKVDVEKKTKLLSITEVKKQNQSKEVEKQLQLDIEYNEVEQEFDSLSDEAKAEILEECSKSNKLFSSLSIDLQKAGAVHYYSLHKDLAVS